MNSYVYLGGIFMAGFNFAPSGSALCNGQLLSISQNTALFALLGTTFGGNGTTTFELPNLQGAVPIHQGTGLSGTQYVIGQTGGAEAITLNTNQIPAHSHLLNANAEPGTTATPGSTTYLAAGPSTGSGPNSSALETYTINTNDVTLNPNTIAQAGGGQAHENRQPFLVVNYFITLTGIFPSRN